MMTSDITSDITLAGGAGEYMESATVVSWSASVGERVKAGDVVVVVETAKAATEIEAERDGILTEILAAEGTEVGIGAILGRIGDSLAAIASAQPVPAPEVRASVAVAAAPDMPPPGSAPPRVSISPLARRLARQAGLDPSALSGTGPGGRIKSRDVERALQARGGHAAVVSPASLPLAMRTVSTVPLVLLHGFGANAAAWNAVRAHLDPSLPVHTPELPGHGRTAALARPSVDALADAVLSGLEEAGIGECDLVGHSLGGAVAAVLSASPAIRVRSLTLIAPAGLGPEIDRAFIDGFLAARAAESLTPWLERLVGDAAGLPRGYAQAVLRERERLGVAAPQAALAETLFPDGTQALRIAGEMAGFSGPLKVIWGRADRIIPARHGQSLPGHVACHGLDGVGHMPHVEAPALVARLIMQGLRSAGG